MICSNCNKEIEDGSRFCEFCGTPQQGGQPTGQPMNGQTPQQGGQPTGQPMNGQTPQQGGQPSGQPMNGQAQPSGQSYGQPMGGQIPPVNGQSPMAQRPPRQPMSSAAKKIIAAAAAAVVIIGIILVVVLNRKTTINLQDYVKVKFDGYNTAGTAYIEFDDDAFYEDVKKSRKVKKQMGNADVLDDIESSDDWEALAKAMQSAMSVYSFANGLDWKLDKDENLSNGDKVNVLFTFNNEKAAESGIKFVGEKVEFTVSGLQEVKEIDPLADITVEFSGTSPDCSADVVNNSTEEVLQNIYYKLSKYYDIAKGEKVTVSIDYDADMEAYYLAQYGCKFTTTSKEFTCDKVDEYVTKIDDIDAETLAKIQKQATDVINGYFAGMEDSFVPGKINFEGCYFLSAKDLSTWSYKNMLYVIYSSEVKGKKKGSFKKTKVFLPVKFTDVLKYADGTLYVDLNVNSIEGYTDLYCNFDTLRGFTKKEVMQNDLVASELSNYSYEVSGNLK